MLLISGDNLKKLISVKQKHRYTKESYFMFQGLSEYENNLNEISLHYIENNGGAHIDMRAKSDELLLIRTADSITSLNFVEGKKTQGSVSNKYGVINIDIYTHKYRKYEKVVMVEYDIVNDNEVSDGFQILWKIKD